MAGSQEFYYKDGKRKDDADLHEPILADGKESTIIERAIERAIERGASRELAERIYK